MARPSRRKRPSYILDDDDASEAEHQPIIAPDKVDTKEPPQKRQRLGGVKNPPKPATEQNDVAPKKPKKHNAVAAGHCSLSKKEFGDRIKKSLALEKYGSQRTRINMEMDVAFFRAFFNRSGILIVPPDFDERTPVVVAELNHNQAGEVFGVSKVKGGNRMVTTYLLSMCVVLYPAQKRASAWLTV